MGKKKGSTKAQLEERLDKVEALLATNVPSHTVEVRCAKEWGLSRRQVRNYIVKVDQRIATTLAAEGQYLRGRLILRAQRMTAKCLADRKHSAAVQSMALEIKLSLASLQRSPAVQLLLDKLGPPPDDTSRLVAWGQNLMAIKMYDVATNPAIDPIRQVQLIGDLGAKLGIVQDKAEVERKLEQLEGKAGIIEAEIEHADEEPERETPSG